MIRTPAYFLQHSAKRLRRLCYGCFPLLQRDLDQSREGRVAMSVAIVQLQVQEAEVVVAKREAEDSCCGLLV